MPVWSKLMTSSGGILSICVMLSTSCKKTCLYLIKVFSIYCHLPKMQRKLIKIHQPQTTLALVLAFLFTNSIRNNSYFAQSFVNVTSLPLRIRYFLSFLTMPLVQLLCLFLMLISQFQITELVLILCIVLSFLNPGDNPVFQL